MKRRFIGLAALTAATVLASACGEASPGAEVATESPTSQSVPEAETTSSAPTGPAEWTMSTLGERGVDAGVVAVANAGTTVIASSTEDGLVAWVNDGAGFQPATFIPGTSGTRVSANALAVVGEGFLLAVRDDDSLLPGLWFSNDGRTWEWQEFVGLDEPTDLVEIIQIGGVTITAGAARVGADPRSGPFEAVIWRSEDLTTWTRAEVDAAGDGTIVSVVDTGSDLLALGRDGAGPAIWRSADAGMTWTRDAEMDLNGSVENLNINKAVQGGGITLAVGETWGSDGSGGLVILTSPDAGDTWTRQTLDPAVAAGIDRAWTVSYGGGAFWIVASRRHDAWSDPDRCYVDLLSCQSFSEPVVLRSADGRDWDELDLDTMSTAEYLNVDLVVARADAISVIGSTDKITAWQWASADAPPLRDTPAPLVSPTSELVRWDARLEPGVTYRYPLYTHCGRDYLGNFNDTNWDLTSTPSGSTPESGWPVAQQSIFGMVTLVADDQIEYSIGDGEVIGIYTATDTEPPGCD